MTNEIKLITKKIDKEFINYFFSDLDVETIFVVGSMAKDDYSDRMDNDYDIRVIATDVNRDKIINFENFLEKLSKNLTTNNIEVGYSTLVGPVNHKVSNSKKNILIHAMIHTKEQMDDFLPITHKYQYGTHYRIVYGKDNLKRFQNIRYSLDELVNAHEGLNYCIDMLQKEEYRYLSWDTDNNKCEFNYHAVKMPYDTIMENCFYSVNKFINNLINYCNFNNLEIPEDKMIFCIRLLGKDYCNEKTLYLLHGIFYKDENLIRALFPDILNATINLLEQFKERVNELEDIFSKEEYHKTKKLVRS